MMILVEFLSVIKVKHQHDKSFISIMLHVALKCRRRPSLIAVHGAPSSCSSRISFSATRLSVSLLRPLNTVA